MKRTLAILFTIAPFVAGAIAALGARHDRRMLWMALVATVVARVVAFVLRGRRGWVMPAATFASAVAAACLVAVAFGAHAVFGIAAVAVVLAGCATAGVVLGAAHTSHSSAAST